MFTKPKQTEIPSLVVPRTHSLNNYPTLLDENGFIVRDLGDGVLQLATKADRIDQKTAVHIDNWLASQKDQPIVFSGHDASFGLGYDLEELFHFVSSSDKQDIENYHGDLAALCLSLSRHNCVAAIRGKCLGYHLELALACTRIVASVDTCVGLDQAAHGLAPACGGSSRLRMEHQSEGAKTLSELAITIGTGRISTNALEAQKLGLLSQGDLIVHHPDRLISEAKRVALSPLIHPNPNWKQAEGPLGGMIDRIQQTYRAKGFTTHDELISDKVKGVFVRSKNWEDALELERSAFLELCAKALSQARIRYMTATGKALRN